MTTVVRGHMHICETCGRRWAHDYELHGNAAIDCRLSNYATCALGGGRRHLPEKRRPSGSAAPEGEEPDV